MADTHPAKEPSRKPPVVIILHGDDEYAIAQELSNLEKRMGDASAIELNTTQLDGRSATMGDLVSVAYAMPFLAKRRLVVLTHPLAQLTSSTARENFLAHLEKIPQTTALVLVVNRPLTSQRDRKNGKSHWLEKWARTQGEHAFTKECNLLTGSKMVGWIKKEAEKRGGEFSPQAATLLARLVGEDPRSAVQEIEKSLAYVNYKRPVESDDVSNLTADASKIDDFALANALRSGNTGEALGVLQKMLANSDPISILHSTIVYQFRLLLLAREVLDSGGGERDVVKQLNSVLGIHPYPARLAAREARKFSLSNLESIYHRLLDLDFAMKTGQIEGVLALNTLVVELTAP